MHEAYVMIPPIWFSIALSFAFGGSLANFLNKYQVKRFHPTVTLFINQAFTLVFMFIILMLLGGIPQVTPKFFLLIFCSSVLDTIAFIALYWAIKHSDISLLAPLSSSTPVFATFFGALFLHEIPTVTKLLGILTVVCGVYLLHVADIRGGIFKPFQKLLSDKGTKLYFIAAVLWGVTPIFQKQAIFQTYPTTPLFASFFGFFLVTLYLSFYTIPKVKREGSFIAKQTWSFIVYGLLIALTQLAAYTVFAMTQIGYATAIFSLSSLFSILFGAIFFKEKRIRERLLGASVMLVGIILLAS